MVLGWWMIHFYRFVRHSIKHSIFMDCPVTIVKYLMASLDISFLVKPVILFGAGKLSD